MDLKEVIERVKTTAEAAYSSFHAGRKEDSEKYLNQLEKLVVEYLRKPATPAGDVTKTDANVKTGESSTEKPAPASPAAAAAAPGAQAPAAQKPWASQTTEKPGQ